MKLDDLLKKKKPAAPEDGAPSPGAPAIETKYKPKTEVELATTPAPVDPFAKLRAQLASGPKTTTIPKPAVSFDPSKAAAQKVDTQIADLANMPMAFGDMTMQAEEAASGPAPVEPTEDPELKSQHQQAVHYYQQQVDRYTDNVVIQTLYQHLLTVTKALRSDEVTDAFHTAAEYLAQNPELRGLLKPFDIGQLVQALQASTGRVIAKKETRTANTRKRNKNRDMLESMFDGMGF